MTESEFKDHPAIGWLNRLANIVADFSSLMACLVLLWLVALTCVDVIGRYFFNSPVTGATELVQMSMAGIIFFSMPAMFLRCLLYTSPSPRDVEESRMPSSA